MDISEFTARRQMLAAATGDIAYTESGTGPAAVFVHGLATSGALWRHVIERVDGTTRCIAVDLPLHGRTPPREDPSVTALAQLIAELCQGLGLDRIDLVGNDTGGVAAPIMLIGRDLPASCSPWRSGRWRSSRRSMRSATPISSPATCSSTS